MILLSKINPKRPQITPEVPKSVHLGHIFLLGLAKTVFIHCPVLHVSTRVEKKQAMCITSGDPRRKWEEMGERERERERECVEKCCFCLQNDLKEP